MDMTSVMLATAALDRGDYGRLLREMTTFSTTKTFWQRFHEGAFEDWQARQKPTADYVTHREERPSATHTILLITVHSTESENSLP